MKKNKKKKDYCYYNPEVTIFTSSCMYAYRYILYTFLHNWDDIVKCFVTFSFRIARFSYDIIFIFYKNSVSGYIIFHLMDAAQFI